MFRFQTDAIDGQTGSNLKLSDTRKKIFDLTVIKKCVSANYIYATDSIGNTYYAICHYFTEIIYSNKTIPKESSPEDTPHETLSVTCQFNWKNVTTKMTTTMMMK